MNTDEVRERFETAFRKIVGYDTSNRVNQDMPYLRREELAALFQAGCQQGIKDSEAYGSAAHADCVAYEADIVKLKAINNELKSNRMEWIDCNERMPEEWQGDGIELPVLCKCNDIIEGWYHVLFYSQGAWYDFNNGEEVPFIVTHWTQIRALKEANHD